MSFQEDKFAKLDDIEYPVIVWEDSDDSSSINIFNSTDNSKKLLEHENRSLSDLLVFYSNYFGNQDVFKLALDGDRFAHPFKLSFSDSFDLSYFEPQLQTFLAEFSADPTLSVELREQLKEYMQNDLAASLQEAIFESIVEKIVRYSLELKVGSVISAGNLNFNERFRALLASSASEFGLDLRFLDEE